MKFKNFTQAYFLIKNNPSYSVSLSDRGQASALGGVLALMMMAAFMQSRIPAKDVI